MVVVRIASPESLDQELQELGIPPTSTFLPALGLSSPVGVDFSRSWYLLWAEDVEERETPMILLPLTDEDSFRDFMDSNPGEFTSRIQEGYALLGKGALPELGNSSLVRGFAGDIEAHADLRALRTAYAHEIQQARDSLQETMETSLQENPQAPSFPGFDPTAMGQMVQAEVAMMFDILEQSEDMVISLNLREGDLSWSMQWAMEPGTPWGRLVSNQEPKVPSGLERVDLNRSMVFWMSHDLSENQELLQPLFEALSGFMKGMNPDVFLQLAGHQMEGVMSMGWEEEGIIMESVYSFPDLPMSEYRDLVREQMAETALEMPGVSLDYRENVGQVGEMEVDLLVQEIQVPEEVEFPTPMQRMEIYYGWGDEELLTVLGSGDPEEGGMEVLRELASRQPGPIPDRVQLFLDSCPEDLLMFGWMDVAGLMEGISAMVPNPSGFSFPEDFPPLVFYGTSDGSQAVSGGSLNLKALVSAVSTMMSGGRGGR